MRGAITAILVVVGAAFSLLASIGILRFPDLLSRMQASTKSATLGVSMVFLAVAVHFADFGVTGRAGLVIGLLLLTAPVSAHMIARAAYFKGVPLWEGTVIDELRGAPREPSEAAPGPAAEEPEGTPGPGDGDPR